MAAAYQWGYRVAIIVAGAVPLLLAQGYADALVDFADEIPLSPLGKPDKKALRQRYWTGTDRQVN